MLLPLRKWIFCLLHASTLVSLIHLAEIPTSCGPNCAFLRAAECIFLQRPTYECDSNDAHIPSSLLKLLDTLPQNIKNLILNGKFKIANSSDMMRVSPSLLNLIPTKVVQLNAEIVSSYLRAYPYESLAATKLISCLNSSRERKAFLEIWSGVESNSKIEDIVASALTIWKIDADWNFLDLVDSNSTVLLHLPPDFLLTFDTKGASEFLFHLGSKFNSISHAKMMRILRNLSSKNLKVLQRAWAILAMRELPDKIKWNKYNFILPGLTLDELKNLEIDEVKPIIAYDFSVAQIRTVVSKIIVPWHINFKQVALWVKFMSPSQIQNLWQFNFKDLKIMANETASYITAKQILLYQLYQLNQKYVKEGKYPNLNGSADLIKLDGGFVAILPLAIIEQLSASDVLTLDSLQKIDSSSMSLSMAYYLTDESRVFNLGAPSKKLTGIRGMLRAIPTSQIMAINGEMSSIILHHLLQNLQGDNVLRNLELLKKCRSFLGNVDYVLKFLLENKDKNMYFSLLSPKDIAHISLSSINDLVKDNYGQRIQELPSHILAAILSNNSPTSWTWNNMFNSSNAFESLLMGLSCKEIRKIADSDFITIIGRYNDERMKIGRVFPKNLQHCGQAALINYLLLKSNLYNEPELIDLLEPSDIEAVGGYILASLPVEEILQAQYSAHIISAIGQLSLPELMLAASQDHLNTLMDEYLNKDHNLTDILNLRNLIHFIPASALVKINPMDLKYMIESGIIDKRLCGDSSTREAWSRLLITIYGSPSKWNASQLETVGDLMIAFSSDRLDTIDSAQWQLLADIAVTRYTDIVEWPKTSTFYQACMSTLIKSEQKRYLEAVKSLARKYFTEVQRMASSIKLNTKDDSIVLIKTNKSSSENLPVPKIISLDEGGSSAEDMYEIFTEEPSTKSHQETTPSPQQLHPKDTLKMKSVSVSSFKSPSEIISTSRTSPEDANVLSSSTKFHPGNVSGENYNPHPRIKSQEDSNEDHASQTNTDSEENGATLFKSPGFPLITEVSTGTPHQQNETPGTNSLHLIPHDHEFLPEFSEPSTVSPRETTNYFSTEASRYGSDDTVSTLRMSFLPENILSKEDEDNGNLHVHIIEPEIMEDNPILKNPDEIKKGISIDSDRSILSEIDTDDSRQMQSSVEDDKLEVSFTDANEKPESSSTDAPNFFLGLFNGFTTKSTISTEVLSTDSTERPKLNFADGPNFLSGLLNGFTTKSVISTTPESVNENSLETEFDSNLVSSTTTEGTEYELGDTFSALLFGKEFTDQAVKVRKGLKQLMGVDKSRESPIPFNTTNMKATDRILPVQSENEEQGVESNVNSSSVEDEVHQSTITPILSVEPINERTQAEATVFNENPSAERNSKPPTDVISSTEPLTQPSVVSENMDPFDFLDYKAGKIISLDNISEMLDLDYDHPLAEVIGKEGISSSEADARFARFRRNADQPSNSGFCDSVKVLGASAVLAVRDFDLHSVTNDELLNCVEDLGKLDLPQSIKEIIWQRVKSLEVVDMAIGTLAGAWKLDDANNVSLNISEDWNLEIIHLLSKYNKDNLVASAVVKKMKKQIFTGELIGEVPEAVIVAMGPLLCHLNPNELQLMFQTPGTFMHVIPIIGNMMRDCEMECLSKFAKLAVAFMDTPDLWTSDMVALLGPIPAGLDEDNWRLLASRPQSVSGLRPSSLECLPQSFLQMMGVEALGSISPLTAKILTDNQLKSLEKQKADVLISVKNEQWSLRNISALHKLNIDTTTKPKIEVDLSSNSNSVTPSILIAVCLSAIFSSWC
nr:PREDICTED: uncharacterized protein LOC109035551 isoform X1 [Bemisia tabaci]